MTHPQAVTPELLAVTQDDREAAARLYRWFPALSSSSEAGLKTAQFICDGGGDGWNTVQAFARHRIAERERCAIIADDGCDNAGDESEQRMARQIAIAIRENTDVQ